MDKSELVGLIATHGSIRKIAVAQNVVYSSVRYWLRKYGLKTPNDTSAKTPHCHCGETDPDKFYYRSAATGKRRTGYCKRCQNRYYTLRWIEKKKQAVIYKGGQCQRCGLQTEHYSVYDFHHPRGTRKQDDWRRMRKLVWSKLVKELDRCESLCANCHRIEHEGDNNHTYHASVAQAGRAARS